MEQLKSRQGLEGPRKISDRMPRDLVRNAQKNPHITAKELQKTVANTGLAVHRTTIQHTLNNKDLHGMSCQKERPQHKLKRLKYANEDIEKREAFWINVVWTDKAKIELFVPPRGTKKYVWRKKCEAFVECDGSTLGCTEIDLLMFTGQSEALKFRRREVGYSSKTKSQSIPRNQP